jgi:hypothetical protein
VSCRKGRAPSDKLLARATAVIDLLVKAGSDESTAAQTVMWRLMAAGIPPPQGRDASDWKRLLLWRANLSHGVASPEAQQEYQDFIREVETIPANRRVKHVLDQQLWDRRRKPK